MAPLPPRPSHRPSILPTGYCHALASMAPMRAHLALGSRSTLLEALDQQVLARTLSVADWVEHVCDLCGPD